MTDITDQDRRDAREWAEDVAETFKYDDEVPRETRAAVNYILATVDAPEPTLAEEVKKGLLFRVNDTDAEGIKDALDLAARVEQIEQERDQARAEVERLTAERDDRPAADLPDPADVQAGQAWDVVHSESGKATAVRRAIGAPWYVVTHNGDTAYADHDEIALVFRLVPAPRQITTREELDALPRRTVIRDKDGVVCERTSIGEGWYCPLEDCDQTHYITFPATVLWTPEETA